MTELRAYRRQLELTQEGLADLLGVPLNSLRMWDSGLRPTPGQVLHRARSAAVEALLDRELLTLPTLAVEQKVLIGDN
jgi:transcriptional regulator with XRE-family HTH domain